VEGVVDLVWSLTLLQLLAVLKTTYSRLQLTKTAAQYNLVFPP